MVAVQQQSEPRPSNEAGFTLVELLVASLVMTLVLGSAVGLATSIQQGYQSELDGAAVEQEARYALDWIARDLRSAGSNPYAVAGQFLVLDPNGGADASDSVRVQADINPPDGDIADPGEDLTITLNPITGVNAAITRQDINGADPAQLPLTETIFTDLQFTYLDAARNVTNVAGLVAYIQVQVSARSRGRNSTGQFTTSTLSTEVRLRTR
jgi:prepilin-type N-terminal cleavage/methylation domain-containing protein